MVEDRQFRRTLFAGSIGLMLIISGLMYFFHSQYQLRTGHFFGKSDTEYYLQHFKKDKQYLEDENHYAILMIMDLIGAKITISFIFWFGMFVSVYFYLLQQHNFYKALFGSWLFFLGTGYLQHMLYVGIWGQTLALMFFLWLLIGRSAKIRLLELSAGLLTAFAHNASALAVCFYYLCDFIKTKEKQDLIYAGCYLVIFLVYFHFNVSSDITGVVLNNAGTLQPSKEMGYLEPPYFFVYSIMLNPFMVGAAMNSMNPVFWGFLFAALFGHNGRMTLFFLPIMLNEFLERLRTPQAYLMGLFAAFMYFIWFNMYFLPQVLK